MHNNSLMAFQVLLGEMIIVEAVCQTLFRTQFSPKVYYWLMDSLTTIKLDMYYRVSKLLRVSWSVKCASTKYFSQVLSP